MTIVAESAVAGNELKAQARRLSIQIEERRMFEALGSTPGGPRPASGP
jgi:hypothetical protein